MTARRSPTSASPRIEGGGTGPVPALALAQVTAGYGGSEILLSATVSAPVGGAVFISGPAGAGKTTLARVLSGVLRPRTGLVRLFGVDPWRGAAAAGARLRRRIGVIAEAPRFLDHLSAAENAALPLRLAGRPRRAYAPDIAELMDFVGLALVAGQPAGRLSGAERRRLAVARALAGKPELIIADEPTAGLAADAGLRIIRLLEEMRKVGATVVLLSQQPRLGDALGGARFRLSEGRLEPDAEGPA